MNIQTILEFIFALAALIIIHELGHFIVARLVNIDVEEFGLGYPPRIVTLFEAKGTKYSLNWLPFGGFVRLKGENDPSIPGSFASAKPWKRIAVLTAGPIMNLLAAVVLYIVIISLIGQLDTTRVEIKEVVANSPAAQAGLLTGDVILKINDTAVATTDDIHNIIYANLGKQITIQYQRGSKVNTISLTPRTNPPDNEGAVGIAMGNPVVPVSLIAAIPAGFSATGQHAKALVQFIGQLIAGQAPPSEARLVGFKGMYDIYNQTVTQVIPGIPPVVNALAFFTSITISLGLLNLLPFPALDGGRILFILPELLFHRRVPQKYESWVNLVGFGILILLMLYVNLQDFINPVALPTPIP